jgi:hypothetical protein
MRRTLVFALLTTQLGCGQHAANEAAPPPLAVDAASPDVTDAAKPPLAKVLWENGHRGSAVEKLVVTPTAIVWSVFRPFGDLGEDGGAIYALSRATGTVTRLVLSRRVIAFTADAERVYYFATDEELARAAPLASVPINGGEATTLTVPQPWPWSVAVNATEVFWATDNDLIAADRSGGNQRLLIAGSPRELQATEKYLFWRKGTNELVRTDVDGSRTVTLARSEVDLRYSLSRDRAAFFLQHEGLHRVGSVPLAGGSPSLVATLPFGTLPVAIDETTIFFVEGTPTGASIRSVPIGGGATTTLVPGANSNELATDDTNLYWADAHADTGARLMAIAKER